MTQTTPNAGTRATVAKLEDARTLLATIGQSLEKELSARIGEIDNSKLGWAHYGNAGQLYEQLENIGDLLGIARNEVAAAHCCPSCGTRDADRLQVDDENVRCTICGNEYQLD